jgi:membrane fusion protein (multidrug efflux system)
MSASDPSPASPEAPDGDAADSGGSPTKRWVALGLAALILVALAVPKLPAADDGETNAASGPAPTGVDAVVVQPRAITNALQTSGTLRANESVDLTAETAGKVTSIRFAEGERVQAGDLLLTTNDRELQAERERLQHRLDLATDRAERQQALLDEGGASQEEVDEIVNQVNVLQAELRLVEARIEKTKVRAPFAGTIGLRQVSAGAYLSPQTTIATLQSVRPIKLDLSVPEKYATELREGTRVTFTVRGSDRTVEGRVYAVEPSVNPETRSVQLRARAPNDDGLLRPGMFADVQIELATVEDALVVPAVSVVPALGAQRVFVAEGGTAQPRTVSLGVRTDSTVQITDGLAVGDTVITSGIQDLRAGLPIRLETLDD